MLRIAIKTITLTISVAAAALAQDPHNFQTSSRTYGARPALFVPNKGQAPADVLWQAIGAGFEASFRRDGFALSIQGSEPKALRDTAPKDAAASSGARNTRPPVTMVEQRVFFVGASAQPKMDPLDPQPAKFSFFRGRDRSKWAAGLATYSQLRYRNLYPGIDLVFYAKAGSLEYDFVVAPGADPGLIRLRVEDGHPVHITENGVLQVGDGAEAVFHRPMLYQNMGSGKKAIEGKFVSLARNTVGFRFGGYDASRTLVIDPALILSYSTYLGGPHTDQSTAVAVDPQGNSYILGWSASTTYPVSANAYQPQRALAGIVLYNMVLTKISPSGTLLYSTFLGGSTGETSGSIVLDAAGNAYVTGTTKSTDYPVTGGAYEGTYPSGAPNSFVVSEISPDGSALVYSTFFGGPGGASSTAADGIAFYQGNLYVVGTAGTGLPTTTNAYLGQINSGQAAFVAAFNLAAAGTAQLVASTYYGVANPLPNDSATGNGGYSMVLDASGNPWIAGQTYTNNLPTTATALQRTLPALSTSCQTNGSNLNSAAYIAQLSSDLTRLLYGSYFSGQTTGAQVNAACSEYAHALALDSSGNVYVAGATASATFPTTGSVVQASFPGSNSYAGFISKLSSDGTQELWSSYIGGNAGYTFPTWLAIDTQGDPWVGGLTQGGTNFPISTVTFQNTQNGTFNGFLTQFSTDGTQAPYSTYIGGSGSDQVLAFGFDPQNNVYVTGSTTSTNFPVTANAFQPIYSNGDTVYQPGDIFFLILAQNAIVTSVGPTMVGNNGDTTITITGAAFSQGSSCSLVDGSTTITAAAAVVAADGTSVTCTFALNGATPSAYDLAITAPGNSTITQKAAVTVQNGGQPNVSASVVGRSMIRTGVPSTYYVTLSNSGTADAYYVQWTIMLSPGVQFSFPAGPIQVSQPDTNAGLNGNYYTESDGTIVIPFLAFHVPAGSSLSVPIQVTVPGVQSFAVYGGIQAVWFDSYADTVASFASLWANPPTSQPSCVSDPLRPYLLNCLASQVYMNASGSATGTQLSNTVSGLPNATPATVADLVPLTIQDFAGQLAPPDSVSMSALQAPSARSVLHPFASPQGPAPVPNQGVTIDAQVTLFGNMALVYNFFNVHNNVHDCKQDGTPQVNFLPCVGNQQVFTYTYSYIDTTTQASCGHLQIVLVQACGMPMPPPAPKFPKPGPNGAGKSDDPNYKSGPTGSGTSQYVAGTTPLTYNVGFENEATATLPAANVVVTDQLNATVLDLTTLTLKSIVIGGNVITIPPNTANYTTIYPLNSSLSVRIQGSLNIDAGVLKFTFTSIDPSTGLPPTDPTVGFLPPDANGVEGQGAVVFSVAPLSTLTTGTQITNQATVVFDANAPINTATWLNTIDVTRPVSSVTALSANQSKTCFTVAWSGTDVGSGIANYAIYVSDNGRPFTLWQTSTSAGSAIYTGQPSHTYGFYSIATDGVGNMETKTVADTVTSVKANASGCVANSTTTTITVSPDPAVYDQPVTIMATVSNGTATPPNGGNVTFMAGSVTLGVVTLSNGQASYTTTVGQLQPVAQYHITASFGGNSQNAASSPSKSVDLLVNPATTTTLLTSSVNPGVPHETVTFTATVSPAFQGTPTGTVTFYNGSSVLQTVSLVNGVATYSTTSLAAGARKIKATYNGSLGFKTSSGSLTEEIY
jgi:hypothetical protein